MLGDGGGGCNKTLSCSSLVCKIRGGGKGRVSSGLCHAQVHPPPSRPSPHTILCISFSWSKESLEVAIDMGLVCWDVARFCLNVTKDSSRICGLKRGKNELKKEFSKCSHRVFVISPLKHVVCQSSGTLHGASSLCHRMPTFRVNVQSLLSKVQITKSDYPVTEGHIPQER
jgi:hypothetical protein